MLQDAQDIQVLPAGDAQLQLHEVRERPARLGHARERLRDVPVLYNLNVSSVGHVARNANKAAPASRLPSVRSVPLVSAMPTSVSSDVPVLYKLSVSSLRYVARNARKAGSVPLVTAIAKRPCYTS